MAGGGFFSRLRNLWRGFLSIWISDVEKEHPEIAYENAINSMIEKYTQLKKAAQVSADLNTAVETNQADLGMVLIQKQTALEAEVTELKAEQDVALKDADSAKASLMQVQGEIKKLKAEKDNMMAKMASAQARLRIQEQLDGLSVEADVKALDNVREHIKNTIAQANLSKELGQSDLDQRLKALRAQTGDVTAKSEWERLQAARAAKQGQKTM